MDTAVYSLWRAWQEAQGLSERTIVERERTIRQLCAFARTQPLDITTDDIIRFTSRRDVTASSRASYHASIRALCIWMVRAKLRTDNPASSTISPRRPKSQPRPVLDVQLTRMLEVANRRRTRTMIILAAFAGLREHEVAKFHGSDLDHDGGILEVIGKGGKTALLPAHEMVLEEAAGYPRNDWWFPAYGREGPITPAAVYQAIKGTMLRAHVPGTPHQLRHWYGTTLLGSGVDLRVVQTLMRHESPATTAIYTRVDPDRQRAAIGLLKVAA
jgi:site-specific recombinase XerD